MFCKLLKMFYEHQKKGKIGQQNEMDTRFYLYCRQDNKSPKKALTLCITKDRRTAYIQLDVQLFPEQWDKTKQMIVNHDYEKPLNSRIYAMKMAIDNELYQMEVSGEAERYDVRTLRDILLERTNPEKKEEKQNKRSLLYRFEMFRDTKHGGTKAIYERTLNKIREFCSTEDYQWKPLEKLDFEDINRDWLTAFENYLAQTMCKNGRNILLRSLRAVFNDAIDNEITNYYPFRRFKIISQPTRKRSLSVEDLRLLFNYPVEEYAQIHLDMFKLIFMLIGINAIDLCHLKDIVNGRIEYNRAKTHKLYSIKVEPEALEIIERYRGQNWLINALDRYKDYHDFTAHMNKALKRIGPMERKGLGGKKIFHPLFPDISAYWARHTWATIAADLDIPMETISHALGHSFGCDTTAIYINFNNKKIDEANRKVLDWVLYEKR